MLSDDSDLDALKERRKELVEQLAEIDVQIAQLTLALVCFPMWIAFGRDDQL